MKEPRALKHTERMHLDNIYCCVLVQGIDAAGQPCYCYFGLFIDRVEQVAETVRAGKPFNPKDVRAIVLARSVGEPSADIRAFMRHKFSFAEDEVILELSPESSR